MTRRYERKVKRKFDCILGCLALLLALPLLLLIGLLIKLEDGGKIVFTQYRLGKNRVPFKIYKFRTMKENHEDPDIRAFQGDKRITRVGVFLRRTSLDELPQLLNILRGDMAIIGPRPVLPEEAKTEEGIFPYERRFSCLPGLFCTVDMKYRAAADRELQYTMDVSYAENISFTGDMVIAFHTAVNVLLGSNVYSPKH